MGYSPVTPRKEQALARKMARLGLQEADIREQFIRSRGKGGQKVNKTETCVYLKHLPTGIEVKCRQGRSQGLNRYYARVILVRKMEVLILGRESAERAAAARVRRQKRRRSRRARIKMLEDKSRHGLRKKLRRPLTGTEAETES